MNRRAFLASVAALVTAPAAVLLPRREHQSSRMLRVPLGIDPESRVRYEAMKKVAKAKAFYEGKMNAVFHLDPTAPPAWPDEPVERRGYWRAASPPRDPFTEIWDNPDDAVYDKL